MNVAMAITNAGGEAIGIRPSPKGRLYRSACYPVVVVVVVLVHNHFKICFLLRTL